MIGMLGLGALVERKTGGLMRSAAPGEKLPPPHDDVDIGGVELQTVAGAAGHLGRDQGCARAKKRVVDRLAGPTVVFDRAAHTLDRLLGAMPPALLALPVAERVVVGDLPERGLGTIALPLAGLALAHGIPAGLVLPVVVAAAQREVLLGPYDL